MTHATTVEHPSDADLVVQAARGDEGAYTTLVRRHYAACVRFAERMLHDRADAEDAVQDVFMRAHLAIARYDERHQFRSWLFRILVNRCRTLALQRARRRRRFPLDEVTLRDAALPPVAAPERIALAEAVRHAVEELEPLLREAFLLKYVEEMEYQEMSAVLGASVSALKMRVKRACDALRPRLEAIYDDA
jgi:RNA polymerase sigma-70 factor, ECF subfamily